MESVDMAVEIAADPGRVRAELPRAVAVWLRHTAVESRAGGEIAVVTGDAPVSVVSSDDEALVTAVDDDGSAVTTTWTVDGRPDRTTVVTARSSGAADPRAFTERMTTVLVALAAHLEHFPDPPGTELHAWGPSRGRSAASTQEQAHARFLGQVGMVAPRQPFTTFRGVPTMAGTCLERRGGQHHSGATLLLDEPLPGVVVLSTSGTPPVHEIHALLFGDDAVAERLQAQWAAWLASA
ncbi:hypothetical protein [Actinomycetospora termitidis]|uniref:Uncharacterized protein n=1 Tax=Actinomycetospora termitidis TaxID=3053470 RepID=A0ABT7MC19_9PSEU|nr:hypothetical protein [Actinomycetospora sp. Odt1-22]MDL5158212.1 hypothetical protein [Actinomycetospora sp. Odt1-22]